MSPQVLPFSDLNTFTASTDWLAAMNAPTTASHGFSSSRPTMISMRSTDSLDSTKENARRNRNKQACIACRRRKIRCTGSIERCTHCTEKNQDCRFEAVTEEDKLKAQSYKSRLLRRRRQNCVLWDVLPASAFQTQGQVSPSALHTGVMSPMAASSFSAPTSPQIFQNTPAYQDSPFLPNDASKGFMQSQQNLHPSQTYQSLASPFDAYETLPKKPHTSYSATTVNPFFQDTAAVLSSSMLPGAPSFVHQHTGIQPTLGNDAAASTLNRASLPLSPPFSSPALSVSSPTSSLMTPQSESFASTSSLMTPQSESFADYTSTVQQKPSQCGWSAGLGLHGPNPVSAWNFSVPTSMALPPSVMAPTPDRKCSASLDSRSTNLASEYDSAAYSTAPNSTLESAGLIRPFPFSTLSYY